VERSTARDRIMDGLRTAGYPLCDDCLVASARLTSRQEAHQNCTALYDGGRLSRVRGDCGGCGRRKIVSRPVGRAPAVPASAPELDTTRSLPVGGRPWSWEGNVQTRLATWLSTRGFAVRQDANTAAREHGIDVIARSSSRRDLLVTVKGWPEEGADAQARHWFAGALLDLALSRSDYPDAQLGVAFPDGFATYKALAHRTAWLAEAVPFSIFWVAENGEVTQTGSAS
jgi:hypothetical protein